MFLTDRDRKLLAEALSRAIPGLEPKELRQVFILMAAILHDFGELRAARDEALRNHLLRLKRIEEELRARAEAPAEIGEPEKKIWH